MESGALEIETTTTADPRKQPNCSIASLRRRAWAQSKDSIWHESEQEHGVHHCPEEKLRDGDEQRPSEEPGQVPNKITSWLIECGTPIGASLDDQSASPNRGVLKNGCSFEDDLSLGAEANHLQSSIKKADSCFGLAADQKRSQYKERGRSMNSTGSGKSSTVSRVSEVMEHTEDHPEEVLLTLCVSELLDLYEEDPEEILLNLGFGREEPDLASKVPSRFLNGSSSARGIDIKVYLGAQMQRMELENPNYALTSRFRQIEVLTTVANEFFQLYSQVSGQPVERISSKDQGDGVEEKPDEPSPVLKRGSSARNVAKFLKKTITKHNLLAAASPEAQTPSKQTRLNGHTPSDHMFTNGHTGHSGPEQESPGTSPDHQVETAGQKHNRKKDSCSLATVTEETNGDGETDCLTDNSPQQSHTQPTTNGECQPDSADLQSTNQRTEVEPRLVKAEKSLTSTPVKAPQTLTPPQLAQLRNENAESFDMEEIQSNEDEALPSRTSRATDLLRTVSQQSDSSGFAEEPSADSNSYLKIQESCDSCDSETTVTSHPSQDVATPLAMDQPAFDLTDCREEEPGPGGADAADAADGRSSSREEDGDSERSEQIPQYTAHYFPKNKPIEMQQDEIQEEENPAVEGDRTDPQEETESEPETKQVIETEMQTKLDPEIEPLPDTETEVPHIMSAAENEPQHTENQTETNTDTEPLIAGEDVEDTSQDEPALSHSFDEGLLPVPSSPVLGALKRAKQSYLSRTRMHIDSTDTPRGPVRGRGRRGITMQRSSSLPSTILSPATVVSSVRIQFGQGQTSCTLPRYSFRYTQADGKDKEVKEVEVEKEKEGGQTNCLSTLTINPALSTSSNNQAPRLSTDAYIPPNPIPCYLLRSSCSLSSSSPPPDWSPSGPSHCWSTQSFPDLSSHQQPPGHFQKNTCTNQNQQSWNQGQMMFSYSNPTPTTQYVNPSPHPSPSSSRNPSPYPFTVNPLHYPFQPYTSLPNLHYPYSHSMTSLSSLHQPPIPTAPLHSSLSNLHQPPSSIAPQHINLGSPHSDTPITHHQGYNHPFSHQSPYHTSPYGSQFASPHFAYPGYNTTPHPAFPYSPTASQYPLVPPQHEFHQSLAPPAPGFLPGLASPFDQGNSLHPGFPSPVVPGLGHSHGPSNTEMQLRKVLHDIRGTVQSLSRNRANTPDMLSEHTSAVSSQKSLAEFQHKRWSLNLFRSQMMDLELSIIRQQAQVYKHLSPADRLEVEQLHSLRSSVREQLQELEQQLEERLTQHRGLHRDSSVDNLSTASALRAMEPMSDLLREQVFLQSELSYDGHTPSTTVSSRSSSPVVGGGRDGEQGQGVYRASINITPVPPPRARTHAQEEEVERKEGVREGEAPEDIPTGGVGSENLQQLIREIRESVTEEVRREILSELLAAVSTRESSLTVSQHPL